MDEPSQEKRRSARASVELEVQYKRVNAFFSDYTRNISQGGTFIETTKPLEVGTEFVFRLTVPHMEEPLVFKGLVKWVVTEADRGKDPERPEPGMGIEFLYDSEDERQRIKDKVRALIREQLGEQAFDKLVGDEQDA
ncbi:MAG: TIGR02266 family protein [Pseudomonadota bacterium]